MKTVKTSVLKEAILVDYVLLTEGEAYIVYDMEKKPPETLMAEARSSSVIQALPLFKAYWLGICSVSAIHQCPVSVVNP